MRVRTDRPSGDRPASVAAIDAPYPQRRDFPTDVEATIYRPARSAMTSGKGGANHWVLEFEPRSPQFVEPLMGWTGGRDPLRQFILTFPDKDAAVAFAERHGIRFSVREPRRSHPRLRRYADNFPVEPTSF